MRSSGGRQEHGREIGGQRGRLCRDAAATKHTGGPASALAPGPPAERPPLATDEKILNGLFWYFSACEKCVLAQVCKAWRRVLYQPKFWAGLTPVLHAKELYNVLPGGEKEFVNLQGFAARGFEGFCLVGVSDLDICEFIDNYALSKKGVKAMSLKRSTITDAGLEVMLEQMQGVVRLELSGCNDFTEAGLWSSLSARITSLSVSDCINVADDAIAAISQLLPNLAELSLQAYHVTDTALAYFTARQGHSTHTLRLLSCWEITNHGVVNVVHSLPNLTALSLSGCSKVTDDGVELVAENLRKLRSLDLSWCPRITDMALEYVACDLHRLEELVLDSQLCPNVGFTNFNERARKMSSPGIDGDPKPPCLPRNGLVKLPGQPNGLGHRGPEEPYGLPASSTAPCLEPSEGCQGKQATAKAMARRREPKPHPHLLTHPA
ncbi:PREDICTED: F-box/LRR-repeat protein 16 [Mandrillus leucophaeus]|uniref:F-box/LRR-repeat protein 16 n=1 Tax=Mandrillus leucophaeus TaxID=9568 RepID=UPI0005F39E5D|nr:PREDICTED: F-box/LRR-repeat protein 16 [Mandrillus leucophaeus]